MKIYAIYKGDKYLCDGTAKECAEKLNVKQDTIYFYATNVSIKRNKTGRRTIAVVLDKDDKLEEYDE